MNFELLPGLAPWLYAFVILSSVLTVVAVLGLMTTLVGNRRIRLSRSETIGTYYGSLAFSH